MKKYLLIEVNSDNDVIVKYFSDLTSSGQFTSTFKKSDVGLSPEELAKREKQRETTRKTLEKNIDKLVDIIDSIVLEIDVNYVKFHDFFENLLKQSKKYENKTRVFRQDCRNR